MQRRIKRTIGTPNYRVMYSNKHLNCNVHPETNISLSACFLNLLRKTVITALTNQGFLVREILVNRGNKIALVLTLPEENIKKEAARMGLNKGVEFGRADILSLEPVDAKGRPLRLNAYLLKGSMWKTAYEAEIGDDPAKQQLRKRILNLLQKDCNMKKMVRIAKGIWAESSQELGGEIYEPVRVSLQTWVEYANYLTELSVHLKSIEFLEKKIRYIKNSFYGGSRIVQRGSINRSFLEEVDITKMTNRLACRAFRLSILNQPGLINIWNLIGKQPSKYSFPYSSMSSKMKPNNKLLYETIWEETYFTYPHNKAKFNRDNNYHGTWKSPVDEEEYEKHQEEMEEREKPELYHSLFAKSERLKVCGSLVCFSKADQ